MKSNTTNITIKPNTTNVYNKKNIDTQMYQIKILCIKISTKNFYSHLLCKFTLKPTTLNLYTYKKFIIKLTTSNLYKYKNFTTTLKSH